MEFNINTLKPLYRLNIGIEGESNAFLIALRLGMNSSIIERAHEVTYKEKKDYSRITWGMTMGSGKAADMTVATTEDMVTAMITGMASDVTTTKITAIDATATKSTITVTADGEILGDRSFAAGVGKLTGGERGKVEARNSILEDNNSAEKIDLFEGNHMTRTNDFTKGNHIVQRTDYSQDTAKLEHQRQIEKFKEAEKKNKLAERQKARTQYKLGDNVYISFMERTGIICELENSKGEYVVMVMSKKLKINKKRLALYISGDEMYPEDYDFDIVFESKQNRKSKHLLNKKHVEGVEVVIQ